MKKQENDNQRGKVMSKNILGNFLLIFFLIFIFDSLMKLFKLLWNNVVTYFSNRYDIPKIDVKESLFCIGFGIVYIIFGLVIINIFA